MRRRLSPAIIGLIALIFIGLGGRNAYAAAAADLGKLPVGDVCIPVPDVEVLDYSIGESFECEESDIPIYNAAPSICAFGPEPQAPVFNAPTSADLTVGGFDLGAADGSGYGLSTLKPEQQVLYNILKTEMESYVKSADFGSKNYRTDECCINLKVLAEDYGSAKLSMEEIYWVGLSFFYNNPQYFFCDSVAAVRMYSDGVGFRVDMRPEFRNADVRTKTANAVITGASAVIAGIEANPLVTGSDDEKAYAKAVLAHDWLVNEIDYKYDSTGQPDSSGWAHTLAGVFTGYGVVCEGYAKAYHYLLNRMGVPCAYIVGVAGSGGAGGGGGHAWNAVKLGGSYYAVDTTWDDLSEDPDKSLPWHYLYFCMKKTEFEKLHTAFTTEDYKKPGKNMAYWQYKLPALSDSSAWSYYEKYGYLVGENDKDTSSIERKITSAISGQNGRWVQLLVHGNNRVNFASACSGNASMPKFNYIGYSGQPYLVGFAPNVSVSVPSTALALNSPLGNSFRVGDIVTVNALLTPSNSDDIVVWDVTCGDDVPAWALPKDIASITKHDDSITLRGMYNGTLVVTAKTLEGGQEQSINISFAGGEVLDLKTYVIFKNGGTLKHGNTKISFKSVEIEHKIKATNWVEHINGKVKRGKGKLVYVITTDPGPLAFDTEKHLVNTKSNKEFASVNAKGVVTAKKAGEVYVHVVDTGTLTEEVSRVIILNAPTKISLSSMTDPSEKSDYLSKTTLAVGETQRIYVIPSIKDEDEEISTDCDYIAEVAKEEYLKYIQVTDTRIDRDTGIVSFMITGLSADNKKHKPAAVKINVYNIESAKKTTLTVYVTNPVYHAGAEAIEPEKTTLAKKGSKVKLGLLFDVPDYQQLTTDSFKVYVGNTTVDVDDRGKVTYDKGASVTAKLDKHSGIITLEAKKDAEETAVVAVVVTSADKTKKCFIVASVDESGKVTAYDNREE